MSNQCISNVCVASPAADRPSDISAGAGGTLLLDGRIAAAAPSLLRALGFDISDDLRGLSFGSFWRGSDRPAALAALRRACGGKTARVDLDIGYIHNRSGTCTVTLAPAGPDGAVSMTLLA